MSTAAADPNVSDPCAYESPGAYSQGYHIGAVFIILAASVLGTGIPVVAKYVPAMQRYQFPYICGKHIGTGVLVSLSLIHLLAPAFDELGNPCNPPAFATGYEYAPLFCVLAALAMHFIETLADDHVHTKQRAIFDRDMQQEHQRQISSGGGGSGDIYSSGQQNDGVEMQPYSMGHGGHHHGHGQPSSADADKQSIATEKMTVTDIEKGDGSVSQDELHQRAQHIIASWARVQKAVSAYVLEFGCTSHSVIIGISVGVAADAQTNTLLPALVFHQFFEGFALGARIGAVGFSKWNELLLALIYSTAAPIGIAIGIGIVSTYNGNAVTANLVQGSFDAVSAGIILYVAFAQMLAIDFPEDYANANAKWKKVTLWICLYIGASVMAVIGIWL